MQKCTIDLGSGTPTAAKACRDGYVSTTGKCVTNCGAGYYGLTSYTKRGNIKESKCTACSSSCYECIGGLATQCISCP